MIFSHHQIQRNLQLRIEEQGRYIQIMFEKQRKMEEERSKTPMSNSDEPSHSPTKTSAATANNNEKSEILEKDKEDRNKGSGSNDSSASAKPPEENPSKEQKSPERKVCKDIDEDSIVPPAKRTKADDSSTSS